MRFFGHSLRSSSTPARSRTLAAALTSAALLLAASAAHAQAPYVLPYTMSTFAGPHGTYTVGQACAGSTTLVALDSAGDGCLASQVSVGVDPHDIRIDAAGNLYYIDNTTALGVVHKIDPFDHRETIYVGNLVTLKACAANTTKYGDGCPATDGAANSNPVAGSTSTGAYSASLKTVRGIGLGPNGDLYIAGYNDNYDHRIALSTYTAPTAATQGVLNGFMFLVAGTGSASTPTATPTYGPVATAAVNSSRGISADAAGNVYIADTGDNVISKEYNGTVSGVTALNASKVLAVANNVAASTAQIAAPEDAQTDSYGNLFIADFGNNVVQVIVSAAEIAHLRTLGTSATFFNIPQSYLTAGNIYWIAGYNSAGKNVDGTIPTLGTYTAGAILPATTITMNIRKLAIDLNGDLYIADNGATSNVVWFIDHATGYTRALAGNFGAPGGGAIGCATGTDTLGDGCPATQAGMYLSSSNSGVNAAPDNQGNLYINDPEGSGNVAGSRIREVLSGLNFPPTTTGASVTQTVLVHLAVNDTPLSAVPAFFRGASDYSVSSPTTCTVEPDKTDDCLVTLTFKPSVTGPDPGSLYFDTTNNGEKLFVLTGTGTAATVAFDPGNTALFATVTNPQGVVIDPAGNYYIANTASGTVTTYLPSGTPVFTYGQGVLKAPTGLAFGVDGALYIADPGNNAVYRLDIARTNTPVLFAGGATSVCPEVTQYVPGATDSVGDGCLATQATLSAPSGVAVDSVGNVYISDTGNNLIRQVSKSGFITLLAGGVGSSLLYNQVNPPAICSAASNTGGDSNGDNCPAVDTIFKSPAGMVFDPVSQSLIVADSGNSLVRRIALNTTFTSSSAGLASNIQSQPVTLIAGNGQAGSSIDANNSAILSQLNHPTGVAIGPAGTVYIADTGNHAVRMVTTSGVITTIAGILGASGTGTVPASAIVTQLNSPGALTVTPSGTLYISDSGNNRVLSDTRSAVSFDFGRTNQGFPSPIQNFTEVNIGTTSATLPSPIFSESPTDSQLTLVAAANSNASIPACAPGAFASGAICNLQGQFNPTDTNQHNSTFSEAATGLSPSATTPAITLKGLGAILTTTNSAVTQTSPATGNAQFGGTLTLTTKVTPASCNSASPAAFPTGNITFIVDGTANAPFASTGNATSCTASAQQTFTGLSVGQHKVSCQYSGDNYYASGTCPQQIITIAQAGTTSVLSFTNNNQPQFTPVTLQTIVTSNTSGTPTGTVTFYATLTGSTTTSTLGTTNTDSTGTARLNLFETNDANGNPTFNNTLLPGTYNLTCQYNGATNYATSNCLPQTFTVQPQPQALTLTPRGCVASSLYSPGTSTAVLATACPYQQFINGVPDVAVAQGSTTDVTLFITPTNTVNGTLSFSCSGLPANSTCTFSPTSIPVTASTSFALPVYTDVTLWTDLQPVTSALDRPGFGRSHSATSLAGTFGWPLVLLGIAGLLGRRRIARLRSLGMFATLVLLAGSALTFTGCTGGPGAYQPNFTAPGTYPITLTVKASGNVVQTTVIDFTVTSPGIPGQQ